MAHTTDKKIKFSIGAKLILIITFILLVSFCAVIVLFYRLSYNDLLSAAEKNNLEANQRYAMRAHSLLAAVESDSRAFFQSAAGSQFNSTVDSYFARNPHIAALFIYTPGQDTRIAVNRHFIPLWGINENYLNLFINSQSQVLGRVMPGQTAVQSAAGIFPKSAAAMFYSLQGRTIAGVIFSSDDLNDYFGSDVSSYMINASGDIIVYPGSSIAGYGVNTSEFDFFKEIINSEERSGQNIYKTDFYSSFLSDNRNGRFFSSTYNNIKQYLTPYITVISDQIKNIFSYVTSVITNEPVKEKNINNNNESRQIIAFTKLSTAGVYVITFTDYDNIFNAINEALLINIIIVIIILITSIIIVSVLSKSFSVPLKALAASARQTAEGNFNQQLQVKNKDEIGALSFDLEKMNTSLRSLARFVSIDVASKSMRGEINNEGALKHGFILFSDIVDFTAKLKNFSVVFGDGASGKIVQWLNQYYSRMTECVEKTGGYIDKFIGDGIMAHWGTASTAGSPRKDAFNCVKAALLMRKALFFMNRERKSSDYSNPFIHMGFGIGSGMVTAGLFGGDTRTEFSVIGNSVNLASRINSLTKQLGADILVCEDTWNLIGDKFITKEMPPVSVRGEDQPLRTYAIINFFGEAKGPQSIDDMRALTGLAPEPNLNLR